MNEANLRTLMQAIETRDAEIIAAHVKCFTTVRQTMEQNMATNGKSGTEVKP